MSNNNLSSAEIKLITGRTEKSVKELYELQRKCDLNVCSSVSKSIASEVDAKLKNTFIKNNKTHSIPLSALEIDDLFSQLNTFPKSKRTNSINRKVKTNSITRHHLKGSHSDLRHVNETQIFSASSLTDLTVAECDNNKSNDIEALVAKFSKLKEFYIVDFDKLEKVHEQNFNNFEENLLKLDEFLKIVEAKYPKTDDIVSIKVNPKAEKMIELINQVKKTLIS